MDRMMSRARSGKNLISGLVAVTVLPFAPAAYAQGVREGEADTIIVTAQRREQALQDVPLAISALSGALIDRMGGTELRDVASAVPGLDMQDNRSGENRFTIRGVSEIAGGAPSVGVYIDEIPVSTFSGEGVNLKTFDISRLEVLRGPQGTLYGEGSLGGTIRIITNRPDPDGFAARLDGTLSSTTGGDINSGLDGMINLPLGEGVAVRAAVAVRDSGGWIDNPFLGEKNINGEQSIHARLSGRILASERTTLDFTYIYQDSKSSGPSRGDKDNNHFAGVREPRSDRLDVLNFTANLQFDFATLVSATGYFKRKGESINDFTPLAPLLSILAGTPVDTANIIRPNDQEVFTQEVRLYSEDKDGLTWSFGGFYKNDNLVISNSTVTDPALPFDWFELSVDETAKQFAVFGEIDYALTSSLHGVVGVRYFNEDRDIVSNVSGVLPFILSGAAANNLPVSSSADKFTWRFSIYYDPSDTLLFFATASSGFRAGGINPQAFLFPGAPTSFGPESLWNYEIGAKTAWIDNRLIVNLSAYYIDWSDVIVNAVTGDPLFSYSVNAGTAHSKGIELEILGRPTPGLELRLSSSINEAKVDSVSAIGNTPPPAVPGARLPFVPQFRVAGSAEYTWSLSKALEGLVRVDGSYTGSTFSAVDNNPVGINDAYSVFNVRAGLQASSWSLTLFADNLFNSRGELAYSGGGESLLINPRTVGLTLRTNW